MRVDLPIPSTFARHAADPAGVGKCCYAERLGFANLGSVQGLRLHSVFRSAPVLSPKKGRSAVSPERSPRRAVTALPLRENAGAVVFPWISRGSGISFGDRQAAEASICATHDYPLRFRPSRSLRLARTSWLRSAKSRGRPAHRNPSCIAATPRTASASVRNTPRAADIRNRRRVYGDFFENLAENCHSAGTFLALATFNGTFDRRAMARNREDISCVFLPLHLQRHPHLALRLAKALTWSAAHWARASVQPAPQPRAATLQQARPSAARQALCVTTSPRSCATDPVFGAGVTSAQFVMCERRSTPSGRAAFSRALDVSHDTREKKGPKCLTRS